MKTQELTIEELDLDKTRLELYSNMSEQEKFFAMQHIRPLVLASQGSIFYDMNSDIYPMFEYGEKESLVGIKVLLERNYDFLLRTHLNGSTSVLGSVAFQDHFNKGCKSRHVFSIYTPKEYRHKGIAQDNCEKTLDLSITDNFNKLRLGQGTEESVNRIINNLRKKEKQYGITIGEEGWIYLPRRSSQFRNFKNN